MTTHSIKLDLDKTLQLPPPTITARQGDTQCGITAMVTDHGAPATLTGYTAKFQAAKPDGTYAEQAAQISGSTVTVELDPQFLAAAGLIRTAYFRFFEGTAEKESTQNMCIRVIHDAEGEAPDLSTSYIPTVDQLVEDATEALNSANTALGNAEEALEDAEAATDSATDAAASANAAANAAQSAIDAMTGNVLRGTVGPSEVVSVDDAYPQVPLGVKVKGLTRQNLWVNPSGTNNGVTVTSNEDGSVTLSGTATNNSTIQVKTYALKLGTKYYLSVDKTIPGVGNGFGFYIDTDSQSAAYVGNSVASGVSYTPRAEASIVTLGLYIASGITVSGTYRVMLNEGSTAEPWCPPGLNSVSTLEIALSPTNMWPSKTSDYNDFTSRYLTIGNDGFIDIDIDNSGGGSTVYANVFSKEIKGIPVGDKVWLRVEWKELSGALWLTMDGASYNWVQFDGGSGFQLGIGSGSRVVGLDCIRDAGSGVVCGARLFVGCGSGERKTGRIRFGLYRMESDANAGWTPSGVPNYTTVDLQGNELCSLPDGTRDELTIGEDGTARIERAVGSVDIPTDAGDVVWEFAYQRIGVFLSLQAQDMTPNATGRLFCDKVPSRANGQAANVGTHASTSAMYAYIRVDGSASASDTVAKVGGGEVVYPRRQPDSVALPAVTLPSLPGPTANVWAVATDGHGNTFTLQPEIELEYARDVTLVIGSLEAKVAALELLHETE